IGLEAVIDFRKESTIVLDFPGGTVGDLLNMLVAKAPGYTWKESDDGVIHVSGRSVPSIGSIVIPYPGADLKTRREIWEDIGELPQMKQWMTLNRCSPRNLMGGWEFKTHNDPISIPPGQMTLAQLLDDVSLKSGSNFWAIVQSPPNEPCWVSVIAW
ncbi:MAG: hypothetical protein WA826_09350, partial [Silvibacterium sp.]